MRRLSATSLKMYLRCPQQWKLKYVDGHEEEDRPFLNLGRAVHAALETFYRGRVAAPAPLEEVLEAFHEEFDPEAYPDEEERERRRADGVRMVEDFHRKHADDFRPALAVEKRLLFEVEEVPFVGFVDRVDRVDDGRIRIVDYKTGGSFDLDRVRADDQLTLYQMGAEEKFGMRVDSLVLYHVPSQTPFEVDRHPEEREEAVRAAVRKTARGIREEEFEPDPGPYCEWCDFRPYCPAWADEFPEYWEARAAEAASAARDAPDEVDAPPSPAEARRLADRYGELKARKEELAAEAKDVARRLEAYFETSGSRSVAGKRFRIRASRRRAWRIDDDEALREVLEPAGLWDRILPDRPHWRTKAGLPEDETLPPEIREACRELARRKTIWRLTTRELESGEEDAEPGDGDEELDAEGGGADG